MPEELLRKTSRSHGIALSLDEKELWMCDVYHDRTYVFDLTVDPPKQIATIVMKGGGYWMCFSPDGKFCYISERGADTVAVIDTKTRALSGGTGDRGQGARSAVLVARGAEMMGEQSRLAA